MGARLRAVRRQKRLSLQAVERASRQEFKASVLGAYERGERTISVPRLQRLAQIYPVPVDQLLPPDMAQPPAPRAGRRSQRRRATGPEGKPFKIAVDLVRLAESKARSASCCATSSPRCRCSARTSTAR